ncbi:elongation factor EF-2 [Nanoarchaeota archaeon]
MAGDVVEKIQKLMTTPKNIRNIGIVAHIDHGKTTLSDSLLAGAGMISQDLAGDLMVMDFHKDEQERGITIDSANVNMVCTVDGEDYLINMIDTPGHVDFSGEVTRAMRATDGAVVVVDAAEGMMPQTETVLRQALKEKVKPILFLNKVDRPIKELKLTPEEMQKRFLGVIDSVNKFIAGNTTEPWRVSVMDGSVIFGSAKDKWGLSFTMMKKIGLTFADIIKAYETETQSELVKKAPVHQAIFDAVVKHLPNPTDSQKYRIKKIWHGDFESEEGKALYNADPKGPVIFVPTKVVIDPHAGEVAGGRLFSGTIEKGQELYLNQAKKWIRTQQINLYKGPHRLVVDKIPAGNIIGVVGLKGIASGETVSSKPMEPFEALKHMFDPVVTISINVKKAADLPKLVEVLKKVGKEDPTVKIEINEETGENLLSGMGELHLEVISNRIITEKGVEVITSPPIVVYRETVHKKSKVAEGKSPNKHNLFFIEVEPLEPGVYDAIKSGDIAEGRLKKKNEELWNKLSTLGISNEEARQYKAIYKGNVFLDATRGIVQIGEVIELFMDGFEQVINAGGIAAEPVMGIKVRLVDAKLHEDAIHRGPAQVYPAARDAIRSAMISGNPVLLEPIQEIQIESPARYLGELTKLVQSKRGQLLDMKQEGEHLSTRVKMPVAEMFGLAGDLRGASEGRATYYVVDQTFAKTPTEIQNKVVRQIRQRKGMPL